MIGESKICPEVSPLREASRHVVRELGFMEPEPRCFGVTHSQCHTLLELERHGVLNLKALSELLCLDKSTMSRVVSQLMRRGLIRAEAVARGSQSDRRTKPLRLTEKGRRQLKAIHAKANAQVQGALTSLTEADRKTVLEGMQIYAKALAGARLRREVALRPIARADNATVARIIRGVMPEFGARGPGFAINDPEVDTMYEAYRAPRSAYFVLVREGELIGGGGIAPLEGGDGKTCELRKMYFLPGARGLGLGQWLLEHCLAVARNEGFARCYLETLHQMTQARRLYERNGFLPLEGPLGQTGHFGCDAWYVKPLGPADTTA